MSSLAVEDLLARLAQRVQNNYASFPRALFEARMMFCVDQVWWTMVFEAEAPRLFRGVVPPPDPERSPFLVLHATPLQLGGLLRGDLDPDAPENASFAFEGNSPELHEAVGACL